MRIDGIELNEGSTLENATIASGPIFPTQPNIGELFFRSDESLLYIHNGTVWSAIASGAETPTIITGDVSGTGTGTVNVNLAAVGTPGTFTSVTTDAKGRVIAGTNPGFLTANQPITLSGDVSGSGSTAITSTLATVGTPGTYRSVTTDAKGRVTAGTNPTTLSAFGITDAQPLDGDLTSIADLVGTAGLLRKSAANTWALDTASFLTANQPITLSGDASGSGTTAIVVTLPTVGTPGTYRSVTTDTKGRVTAGTNPTTLAGYGITDAFAKTGGLVTGNITMQGSIIPSANITYDLGSPTMMWKDIYVGPGSIYMNGTKILEEVASTIVFSTDVNQNVRIETNGTGNLELQTDIGGAILVKGTLTMSSGKRVTDSAGIQVEFADNIEMGGNRITGLGAPIGPNDVATRAFVESVSTTDATIVRTTGNQSIAGQKTFTGDVVMAGNLTISGTTTTVNSQTVLLADNILELNSDFTAGAPTEDSGIQIRRGDLGVVRFLWDEANDRFTMISGAGAYLPLWTSNTISAGSFVGPLTGNATTASTLATQRTINGAAFDGSANISFTSDAVAEGSSNLYHTVARAAAAAPVQSFNTRVGPIVLSNVDVTTALGFTPPSVTGAGASGTWGINITGNAATATNATTLGGFPIASAGTGGAWNSIPRINGDGVMEVGRYIDFHSTANSGVDNVLRLDAQPSGLYISGNRIMTTLDAAVQSFNARTGVVVLASSDVTTALGFTPASQAALDLKANLASPTFTGTVTAPTFLGQLSTSAVSAIGAGGSHDPYGTIAVSQAANATNQSYFGMTRNGQVGLGIGITGTGGALGHGANSIVMGVANSGHYGAIAQPWVAFNSTNFAVSGAVTATNFIGAGTGLTGNANSLTAGNATLLSGYGLNPGVVGNSVAQRDGSGALSAANFIGAGTGLTGTASGLTAGSTNAVFISTDEVFTGTEYLTLNRGGSSVGVPQYNSARLYFVPSTGVLTSPVFTGDSLNLRRVNTSQSGISFYTGGGNNAWVNYMSPAGNTTSGPNGNLSAPGGTIVTSWALRSHIENATGYGWTWESGVNISTTPAIMAELSSVTGNFRTVGSVTATNFIGSGAGLTGITTAYAQNSTRLYATGAPYEYGGTNPYYMYMTYNATANRWRLSVSPTTPAAVEVAYADAAGTSATSTAVQVTTDENYTGIEYVTLNRGSGPNAVQYNTAKLSFVPSTGNLRAQNGFYTDLSAAYGKNLYIGNAPSSGANQASISVTDGNIHIDPATTGSHGTYLNFYTGTAGTKFGNGAGNVVATIDVNGSFSGVNVAAGGNVSAGGTIIAGGRVEASGVAGFASTTYAVNARNPIWRFANSDPHGLSYFQGTAGYAGNDSIGFHFGVATAAASQFTMTAGGDFRITGMYHGNGSALTNVRAADFQGNYISGGNEKPNFFGGGIGRLQMLNKDNLGSPSSGYWHDALWLSGYSGGDVKGSNVLLMNKHEDWIGFARQNFDATTWGTVRTIFHSGNLAAASVSNVGSTLVQRDPSGHIYAGYAFLNYINATDDGLNNGTVPVTAIICKQGDNYYRSTGPARVRTFLNYEGTTNTFTGQNYFSSNKGATSTVGTQNSYALQAYSSDAGAAGMSFHRAGSFAVNMGLDPDNVFRIGGWSAAANRFQMDMSGNLTMAGDVTAYSDERLKKDWIDLDEGFVARWAEVKHGSFERIDSGERQVGLSAQSVQAVIPEAVREGADGTLSLNYGSAAAVASVQLAKKVVDMEAKIARLEAMIQTLMGE